MRIAVRPQMQQSVRFLFQGLSSPAQSAYVPAPRSLATTLEDIYRNSGSSPWISIPASAKTLFATAAVEIWGRGVHSLVISAAITKASPIWAAVAGYYASHYAVRAFAHVLGYFQLYRLKKVVVLDVSSSQCQCEFRKKDRRTPEHRFYWKVVHQHADFSDNPLFRLNNEVDDVSDVGHRALANYADHVGGIPTFEPLSRDEMRRRLERISDISFTPDLLPRRSKFPDIDAVQVAAYNRIVLFRQLIDEVLGGENAFWKANRQPSWTHDLIDFQLVERDDLSSVARQ